MITKAKGILTSELFTTEELEDCFPKVKDLRTMYREELQLSLSYLSGRINDQDIEDMIDHRINMLKHL